ncbi:MAG: hypothetical protein ABH864_00245 [archaeon]
MIIQVSIALVIFLFGLWSFVKGIGAMVKGRRKYLFGPRLFMWGHKGSIRNMVLKYSEYPQQFVLAVLLWDVAMGLVLMYAAFIIVKDFL